MLLMQKKVLSYVIVIFIITIIAVIVTKIRNRFLLERRNDIVFVWDVGGVILHWNPKEFISNYKNGKFLPYFQDIFDENWRKFDRGDMTMQQMLELLSQKLNISIDEAKEFVHAAFLSLKPNWPAINIIQQLKKDGYKNYCLTNGSQEYFDYVNSSEYYRIYGFNLSQLFNEDDVVLSAPLHLAKPEKAIYDYARTKLNIEHKKIIFIDDNKINVDGATNANWRYAILFKGVDDLIIKFKKIFEFKAMIMNQINKVEIGIFLLPPNETSRIIDNVGRDVFDHLSKIDPKLKYRKNIPHISLYQMSIPVCKLEDLDFELKAIFRDVFPIEVELENFLRVSSGNIFWCIKDDKDFRMLENKILNSSVVDLHSGNPEQIKEIDISTLSLEQKRYLDQYGIFWIKNYCTPHFTVFYDIMKHEDYCKNNICRSINVNSEKFFITKAAYGILDYRGNVVKILGIYDLNKRGGLV